jgi:hypothetical protein
VPLIFPKQPTTPFLLHERIHQQLPIQFSFSTSMRVNTKISPLQFPYSPPNSVLSSPLTECQNSPQSESDDLCSACRGAGEFVCCEGCPRVFHLLCCDPPRVQVPEGAPDDAAAETCASLGLLFKTLERTNPRAFALPHEVQNHFEDVSARGDGSYFEEIKKFPL